MSAVQVRDGRLVGAALRCYPARWRRRHADEAAELAALLIADGVPAVSIAWSYLVGAAREWLIPRPGQSRSTVAAALLAAVCLLGISAALVAESAPARAGTTQTPSGPTPPKVKAAPSGAAPSFPHDFTPCRLVGHSRLSTQGTAHARSC